MLTPRQNQVVTLVLTGMNNKEIARALGISLGTVKQHLHAVFEQTGIRSRTRLIAVYQERLERRAS